MDGWMDGCSLYSIYCKYLKLKLSNISKKPYPDMENSRCPQEKDIYTVFQSKQTLLHTFPGLNLSLKHTPIKIHAALK